jgi:L-rhamnose isomerase
MDYFDASINRVSAWTNGMRNFLKALLNAELQPVEKLCELQNSRNFTELMSLQERIKMEPIGDVWDYYCEKMGVPTEDEWFEVCRTYETEVLSKRV